MFCVTEVARLRFRFFLSIEGALIFSAWRLTLKLAKQKFYIIAPQMLSLEQKIFCLAP